MDFKQLSSVIENFKILFRARVPFERSRVCKDTYRSVLVAVFKFLKSMKILVA